MRTRDPALFAATAIPAGAAALALTGLLTWVRSQEIGREVPGLLLMTLFALLSYPLSFSTTGRDRASLELAWFLAAVLALPFPAGLIVGAGAALAGSLLLGGRSSSGGAFRLLPITGANVFVATAIAAAASVAAAAAAATMPPWIPQHADGSLFALLPALLPRLLVISCLLFVVMNTVNLLLMSLWISLRGESPGTWVRHFLAHILPVEMVTIPFGSLLALLLASEAGYLGFLLLASVGLFMSLLLKNLSDSDERLRRANQALEERLGELATLNVIGREITSSLDAARVFEIVRRECRKVFRPDFFWIARIDPETREVTVQYSMAGNAPPRTMTFTLGQGLTTHVIDTGRPLLIRDASRELKPLGLRPIVLEPKIRSIVAVPLLIENHSVGVLSVQSYRDGAYDEHHAALLTTIGQQAAVALENARHYQLATIDRLTGLFQRDYFFQRLADENRLASRYRASFSLMMLDLDSFKRINDRFGHFAGDRFLGSVGACIRSLLRAADIPCRYGGEEFCVLLPETDAAGARTIAERIRREIASLRVAEGTHSLGTTISIGVACYPDHFEGSVTGLLEKADQALYAAKKQGKDRVILAAA